MWLKHSSCTILFLFRSCDCVMLISQRGKDYGGVSESNKISGSQGFLGTDVNRKHRNFFTPSHSNVNVCRQSEHNNQTTEQCLVLTEWVSVVSITYRIIKLYAVTSLDGTWAYTTLHWSRDYDYTAASAPPVACLVDDILNDEWLIAQITRIDINYA